MKRIDFDLEIILINVDSVISNASFFMIGLFFPQSCVVLCGVVSFDISTRDTTVKCYGNDNMNNKACYCNSVT